MIILDATNRSLEFKLSGAPATNQIPFVSFYVDTTSSAYTPGSQNGASNSTTAVTILSAPAASTQRALKYLNVRNRDTAQVTVTLQYNDNATIRELFVVDLAVDDTLMYSDPNGWEVINKSGQKKSISSISGNATVVQGTGTNLHAVIDSGSVGHGKTLKSVSGGITADTDVITAVTSKRLKVYAYSLSSSGTNANLVLFKSNGTAGTELWRVLLQSTSNVAAGANLAISPPGCFFGTNAGEKLTLDVGAADTLHYAISYFDDDGS